MKSIICQLDDIIHQRFKKLCIENGVTIKSKVTELIKTYIKNVDNIPNMEDLVKVIVQKERREKWNKAFNDYHAKKQIIQKWKNTKPFDRWELESLFPYLKKLKKK